METTIMDCPACGTAAYAGDSFCENCGESLAPDRKCAECGGGAFSDDGYCERCGVRGPDGRDHVETELDAASGVTDRGLRHSRNEDAMALAAVPGGIAAVVCDGVSSSPRPQDASLTAAQTGLAALSAGLTDDVDREALTLTALARAAEAVSALAESEAEAPACTYVSALTGPDAVTIGWRGDSRAYWLSDGDPRPLTTDDSWATQMVEAGALSDAEAQAHPNAHVLTGWLGADAEPSEGRVTTFAPDGPGVVLVCSDGLWNYYPEAAGLTAAVPGAAGDHLGAARTLVRLAIEAGGRDNITAVVIPFQPASTQPTTEQAE